MNGGKMELQKKGRILISLDPCQLEWLEIRKQRTGASKAAIIRKLIERSRKRRKSKTAMN
jgi:hypothetical protein